MVPPKRIVILLFFKKIDKDGDGQDGEAQSEAQMKKRLVFLVFSKRVSFADCHIKKL